MESRAGLDPPSGRRIDREVETRPGLAGGAARRTARRHLPILLITPSLLLAVAIILYPFFVILRLSFANVSPFGQVRGFVGATNYANVLADPIFYGALWRTVVWTVCVVGGTVLVAMPAALVLQQDFYGRSVARTIVMLPWALSLAMAAVLWQWSFNADFGMINGILREIGLISSSVHWTARAETAFPVEIGIGILVSIPFTSTIFQGGLSSMPPDIFEAARIDGASGAQQFRFLTLPLLQPFISIAVVLNVIYVFNSFPIIWVMTQGGPDNGTHILVTYAYELAFRLGRPGPAAAVSIVMLGIVLAFTALYLRLQRQAA
ncbi:MAG TPA: sugar ABC transporter permease [Acetobacteraceae bacterium]|nr:sugar ABC transporter permease [Acetobacteraceae bacterium]